MTTYPDATFEKIKCKRVLPDHSIEFRKARIKARAKAKRQARLHAKGADRAD